MGKPSPRPARQKVWTKRSEGSCPGQQPSVLVMLNAADANDSVSGFLHFCGCVVVKCTEILLIWSDLRCFAALQTCVLRPTL